MSFFVNPPLSVLSGSLTPVEAMPHWLQPLTLINPLRHFGIIIRSVLLKGSGLETLWPTSWSSSHSPSSCFPSASGDSASNWVNPESQVT